ncbi:MAG: AbrB/MazE/SpoVT family DNA-binding domain-containing protein [Methanothrix sp.]|nr:AbrB/MazE/SpoVT family DNA-binding domain-containing protein [Methanothrix sp.]MCX8207518.1 AbrB/MazE/SpoVT family DNA-binding domain-containing protein [Methanothrix sp.]
MKTVVRMGVRGIVVIPNEIREVLGLREGDYLEIDVEKIELKKTSDKTT